jgi:hypothetical protein
VQRGTADSATGKQQAAAAVGRQIALQSPDGDGQTNPDNPECATEVRYKVCYWSCLMAAPNARTDPRLQPPPDTRCPHPAAALNLPLQQS